MKRWFGLLMLLVLPVMVSAQAAPAAYRYAYITYSEYIDTFGQRSIIHLVDPDNLDEQQITLPDFMWVCGAPSPDGRWLLVCLRQQENYHPIGLMLMDVQTGAIRSIKTILTDDDALGDGLVPKWSPDSRYIMFNEASYSLGIDNVSLYDVQTGELTTLVQNGLDSPETTNVHISAFEIWMPDSQHIILSSRYCAQDNTVNQCGSYQIEIRHVPDMVLQMSVQLPGMPEGANVCQLTASPYGRYITFQPYCQIFSDIPFKELFIWDTLQNRTDQITFNTYPPPDQWPASWTTYPPEKRASYTPLWYDSRTLLLGSWGEELAQGEQHLVIVPQSVYARTEGFVLDDRTAIALFDTAVTVWAKNPVTDEIALRQGKWFVNTAGDKERIVDEVNIATFDGRKLTIIASGGMGCDDLKWSPDGRLLAFTVPNVLSNTTGCDATTDSAQIRFLAPDGILTDYYLPPPQTFYRRIGWVVAPSAQAQPFFPAGTPTPIPTRGPVG